MYILIKTNTIKIWQKRGRGGRPPLDSIINGISEFQMDGFPYFEFIQYLLISN